MNIKIQFSFIAISFICPSLLYAQNIEKVTFDSKDSTAGYYLAVQPQSKNMKGAIVLFTSFLPPESLLTETKLRNTASANDILTVVAPAKQKTLCR